MSGKQEYTLYHNELQGGGGVVGGLEGVGKPV